MTYDTIRSDRKKGYVFSSNLAKIHSNSFINSINISKTTTRDKDGNPIICKRHGIYEKYIYNPEFAKFGGIRAKRNPDGCYFAVSVDGHVTQCGDKVLSLSELSSGDLPLEAQQTVLYDNNLPYEPFMHYHNKKFYHKSLEWDSVADDYIEVERVFYFVYTSFYMATDVFRGWKNFQTANPSHPLVTNKRSGTIRLTRKVLHDLESVNNRVNHAHTYSPENADTWYIMTSGESGDCEDFALTKAQELLDLGYPAHALHIEGGLVGSGEYAGVGHGWLVVQTDCGDLALDVTSDTIKLNSNTTYLGDEFIYRKRQIGKYWANITPLSWLWGSYPLKGEQTNSVCWYIYDPRLNIFYEMDPGMRWSLPFAQWREQTFTYWGQYPFTEPYSSPSINFSEDKKSIYVHSAGTIYKYYIKDVDLVRENYGTWVQDYAHGPGYVTREGTIDESTETHYNTSLSYEGGGITWYFHPWDVTYYNSTPDKPVYFGLHEDNWFDGGSALYWIIVDGVWDADFVDNRPYKVPRDCRTISEDGYYSYVYSYHTGYGNYRNGRLGHPECSLLESDSKNYSLWGESTLPESCNFFIDRWTNRGWMSVYPGYYYAIIYRNEMRISDPIWGFFPDKVDDFVYFHSTLNFPYDALCHGAMVGDKNPDFYVGMTPWKIHYPGCYDDVIQEGDPTGTAEPDEVFLDSTLNHAETAEQDTRYYADMFVGMVTENGRYDGLRMANLSLTAHKERLFYNYTDCKDKLGIIAKIKPDNIASFMWIPTRDRLSMTRKQLAKINSLANQLKIKLARR
jgi:predicted transglutaminase-like cysteine proteinase